MQVWRALAVSAREPISRTDADNRRSEWLLQGVGWTAYPAR